MKQTSSELSNHLNSGSGETVSASLWSDEKFFDHLVQYPLVARMVSAADTSPLDAMLWVYHGLLALILLGVFAAAWALLFWLNCDVYPAFGACLVVFLVPHVVSLIRLESDRNKSSSIRPTTVKSGWLTSVSTSLSEFGSMLVLYTLLQPLDRVIMPWLERISKQGQPRENSKGASVAYPVLLIHGFFCNSAFWFFPRLFLGQAGVRKIFSITLTPCFGDMNDYTEAISAKIDNILEETGAGKVIIVGHSMGGLLARRFLRTNGGDKKVAKIIALGSPHSGTVMTTGQMAHYIKHVDCQCVAQMAYGSWYLRELNSTEPNYGSVPVANLFSYDDEVVLPQESSRMDFPHAKNIAFAGMGHLSMVFSRKINSQILNELCQLHDEFEA